jgi:Ca-activated chloride channel family protein
MNDNRFKQLFEEAPVPEPNELVRARIKREAMAAFILESSQESTESARPTETTSVVNSKRRGTFMNNDTYEKSRVWTRRIASTAAFVLVLGVSVKLLLDSSYNRTLYPSSDSPAAPNIAAVQGEPATTLNAVVPREEDRAKSSVDALARLGASAIPHANQLTPKNGAASRQIAQSASMLGQEISQAYSPPERINRDRFSHHDESPVKLAAEQPVSTFSIDVDTASYSFVRRQLNRGVLPFEDAVRVEEMINYFDYAYPLPGSPNEPFATRVNVIDSPWKPGNKLVHIGIKGYDIDQKAQPDSNLVFLVDVSGSMDAPDKLPLVKQSLSLLLESLKPTDTVAIVVYAGAAGAVLEPTHVKDSNKILAALEQLQAGGATDGAQGLALAYQLAERNFRKESVNRVILATDGDFNVGVTQDESLEDFVARKRQSGIYLSVFGFGEGNYQDALIQTLAQNGNGVAAYIDTLSEAQKILVDEATSALFPIANDVKIQVEFNPATVAEYRLIGYETRALDREDFNNDKVDAGDIGAGHTVTAIYEITPVNSTARLVDDSRYQQGVRAKSDTQELGFLKLRYKLPGESQSHLLSTPITEPVDAREQANNDRALQAEINFSVAVAGFGQLLRGGKYTGDWNYDDVIAMAQNNKGDDQYGYRTEFVQLVRKAKTAKGM